jgi:UDP-N-acetylglucosamine--N-acetylmuramyl-(pentapeptide) pyrophosphoryl-undecaprenol N-acetylglucosamine transferase
MKIVAAGGASGGHVTPVLAVLHVLKEHDAHLEVCFVTDSKFGAQTKAMMQHSGLSVEVHQIHAGKLRRYHRVSVWRQIADLPTVFKNVRDIFVTLIGFFQSLWLLLRFRPDVVFTKGGFVCVPLGLAAKMLNIPLVIHDSDAHPGLANRILSRWATTIATGSPVEHYPYPREKTHYVGIPVDSSFGLVDETKQRALKAELGFHDLSKPLIVVTGGGLGARNINRAVVSIAPQLVDRAAIYHITGGNARYDEVMSHAPVLIDYQIVPFVSTGMAPVLGAADIVVSRVGATTMQELAALAKPVVMVPNPYLTGGHQLKNARVYEEADAAVTVDEEELEKNPLVLRRALEGLLNDVERRKALGKALHQFARPDAALDMATLIVDAATAHRRRLQKS